MATFAIIIMMFFTARIVLKNIKLNIPNERHILVIGDSYTECAIDDEVYKDAINLSSSGRGFPFSYFLLKDMIEQNPQIDTVLLSYALGRASKSYDDFILYNDSNFREHLPSTILRADYEDMTPLKDVPNFYYYALRAPFSVANLNLIFRACSGRLSDDVRTRSVGKFNKNTRDKLLVSIQKTKLNTSTTGRSIDEDSITYEYLMRIAAYLESKNVRLILFNAPKYKIDSYEPREESDKIIKQKLANFEYLDFSDFPLDDSCFADLGHLNYRGAKIFSEYLQKNGLFSYKGNRYKAK